MILVLNIFFIYGLQFAFSTGNVLDFIPRSYINTFSKSNLMMPLVKPLFFCAPCMSSIWGLGFWFTDHDYYFYPLWVCILCGVIVLVNRKTDV